jgi:hypothetical protein
MGVAQEAKMVKRILLFVAIPLVMYSLGMVKLHAMITAAEAQVVMDSAQIKNYYGDGFAMPSQETIAAQKALLEDARTKITSIISYSCLPMLEIPADVQEYGVYFKERLYLTEKGLTAEAKNMNATLPEDLGFADNLPNESQVPFMIMQLEFVEALVRHCLQSNVKEIVLLELEDSGTLADANEENMPCRNITVKVSMNCSLTSLKKALYEIGNMNPFVVVEGLKVTQHKTGILETHLLITQLVAEGGV